MAVSAKNRMDLTADAKRAMLNRRSGRLTPRQSDAVKPTGPYPFGDECVKGMAAAIKAAYSKEYAAADFPRQTQVSFKINSKAVDRMKVAAVAHHIRMRDLWAIATDIVIQALDELEREGI